MIDVPPVVDMPFTVPLALPIVATDVLPLSQVPPPRSDKVELPPGHKVNEPVIAPGAGLTVMVFVAVQPVSGNVNVITDVPPAGLTPVTTPVPDIIVATPVLPLTHVPVPEGSLSAKTPPGQIPEVPPDIADGSGLTVTVAETEQPAAEV